MQRQPRTPQEAAMLDPLGLQSFPAPNIPRGIFGSARRPPKNGAGISPPDPTTSTATFMGDPSILAPPPIDSAPRPLDDWKNIVGPDLLGQMPGAPPMQPEAMQPAPTMRGGMLGSPNRLQGMFAGPLGASNKIANRGAPLPLDANGDGKRGFDWRMLAGIVGDGLLGAVGQAPIYGPNMWRLRQQQAEHQDRMTQMREQTRLKLTEPEYRSVNNRLVRFTPGTGESDVLYTAPQDFEDYAATLGAAPGTEAYDRLVQDYVLRGSGPTATDNYNIREDWRQENREELEGIRQNNRVSLQTQRQAGQRALKATPSYRQANPLPPRTGERSGGVREGQTATNPQTGAKVVYRGGKWVPAP
jgi:hypothetical protein